jgi:hypothetical protein
MHPLNGVGLYRYLSEVIWYLTMKTIGLRMTCSVLLILSMAGCKWGPDLKRDNPGASSGLEQVYGDLTRARTATEFYVRNARRQAKSGTPEAIEAERLYEEARGSVNAWLVDLQTMVRNGTPITEDVINSRRKTASEAVVAFNSYADQLIHPTGQENEAGAKDAKFLPMLTLDGVIGLGRVLWDEINKRRQANREARERWVQAEVARLEKSQWPTYSEVK